MSVLNNAKERILKMNRTSISDPKQVLGAAFNYYMREVYKNFSHSDDLRKIRHSLEIKLSRIAYVIDNAFTAINDNLKDYLHNPQYLGKLACMPELVLATDFLEDNDCADEPLTLHQWLIRHFDNSLECDYQLRCDRMCSIPALHLLY